MEINPWLLVLVILSQAIFLFPLKDRRGRFRNISWMTIALVVVNTAVHIWVTLNVYWQPNAPDKPNWA